MATFAFASLDLPPPTMLDTMDCGDEVSPAPMMNAGMPPTSLTLPLYGDVTPEFCSGLVTRFSRQQNFDAADPEAWRVVFSGHKKGSNPRIKLENGRLWTLHTPEGFELFDNGLGPAVFALPIGGNESCHLQKYKRQPLPDKVVFSLTDGADKCYLRPALSFSQFRFVIGLTDGRNVRWYVTREFISIDRAMSTTKKKREEMQARMAAGSGSAPAPSPMMKVAPAMTEKELLQQQLRLQEYQRPDAMVKVEKWLETQTQFQQHQQQQPLFQSGPMAPPYSATDLDPFGAANANDFPPFAFASQQATLAPDAEFFFGVDLSSYLNDGGDGMDTEWDEFNMFKQ